MIAPPEPREDADQAVTRVLDAAHAGNHTLASTLAHAALESGVRHPALLDIRARWLAGRGCDEDALADFEALRSWRPDDPVLLVHIGHLLAKLRRPQEALAAFNSAIAVGPHFAKAHYERGVVLGLLGETEEMRNAHERTVALQPDNADALA
ncbi:MAG TPA: tetratricopeptide repeat protein, partial [Rhizomicrobium sp.]